MIVADSKSLEQIFASIAAYRKVMILGCGECMTVCQVGGEKQVGVMAQALRLQAKSADLSITFIEATVRRQCEPEFLAPVIARLSELDAVVSLACGAGVNALAEKAGAVPVLPGVNTTFFGAANDQGEWVEYCVGCGQCMVELTGGICPISRCSKSILNGPCGGSTDGMCEISTAERPVPCAWALIIERMQQLGTLDRLREVLPPKDWQTSDHGGPRRRRRPDREVNAALIPGEKQDGQSPI